MRINNLFESAPKKKGKTTSKDAKVWIDKIINGEASEADIELYNELKSLSKKLGGKTTVIEILKII